jgi:Leucine-rich repeat (LRR) protein
MKVLLFVLLGGVQFLQATDICVPGCECPTPRYVNCSNSFFKNIPEFLESSTLVLDLKDNDISQLEDDVFKKNKLVNLEILNLANNGIHGIKLHAFCGMTSLERLDLSGNKLESIDSNTFSFAYNLRWLSLARNELLIVPEDGCFLHAENLGTLLLSNINIQKIHQYTFECLKNLENLFLDNNKLKKIDVDVFPDLVQSKLRNLKLSGNPWECSCELQRLAASYDLLGAEEPLLCSVEDHTGRTVNELQCYTIPKSTTTPASDINDHYKASFILGVVIGVLSASGVFVIIALLVYLIRKLWDRITGRREHEDYESIE